MAPPDREDIDVMECTENQRVSFTSFMFQEEAERWWEMIKGGAKTLGREISWNFLVKKFNEKYIPGVVKDRLGISRPKAGSIDGEPV